MSIPSKYPPPDPLEQVVPKAPNHRTHLIPIFTESAEPITHVKPYTTSSAHSLLINGLVSAALFLVCLVCCIVMMHAIITTQLRDWPIAATVILGICGMVCAFSTTFYVTDSKRAAEALGLRTPSFGRHGTKRVGDAWVCVEEALTYIEEARMVEPVCLFEKTLYQEDDDCEEKKVALGKYVMEFERERWEDRTAEENIQKVVEILRRSEDVDGKFEER